MIKNSKVSVPKYWRDITLIPTKLLLKWKANSYRCPGGRNPTAILEDEIREAWEANNGFEVCDYAGEISILKLKAELAKRPHLSSAQAKEIRRRKAKYAH